MRINRTCKGSNVLCLLASSYNWFTEQEKNDKKKMQNRTKKPTSNQKSCAFMHLVQTQLIEKIKDFLIFPKLVYSI